MGVIEMKMGIDDVAHGLVGEVLELFHERPRGGGRHVRVDEQDVVFIDDDAAVASDGQVAGSDRVVDVVTDFVEREGLTLPCGAWRRFCDGSRARPGRLDGLAGPCGGKRQDPKPTKLVVISHFCDRHIVVTSLMLRPWRRRETTL